MKFNCNQELLLKKITHAKDIASSKDFNYSLINVLLHAKNNELYILSTNIDLVYKTKINVEVIEEGSCLIHSQKLYEILKNFSNTDLEFQIKENYIHIYSKDEKVKLKFDIRISSMEDFPIKEDQIFEKFLNDENKGIYFEIDSENFLNIIKKSIFISTKDELRPFLNGILLEKEEKKFSYVATDGKRLAYIEDKSDYLNLKKFKIIIPYKTLNELQKILKDSLRVNKNGSKCKIYLTENYEKVLFIIDDNKLLSVLIIGSYPNYNEVIPKNPEHIIIIDRLKLMDSISSMSVMSDQNLLRIILHFKDKLLLLSTKSEEYGSSEDQLKIQRIKGDLDFKIGFNYVSILEFLRQMESEKLEINISDYKSPSLFREMNNENFYFVLAPMKID